MENMEEKPKTKAKVKKPERKPHDVYSIQTLCENAFYRGNPKVEQAIGDDAYAIYNLGRQLNDAIAEVAFKVHSPDEHYDKFVEDVRKAFEKFMKTCKVSYKNPV